MYSFIREGKTNVTYLLLIAVIALVAGGVVWFIAMQ
jgi:hypothetical protein